MIILNIKNLRFKIFEDEAQKIELKAKGEGEVRGSAFKCPSQVKLANPDLHIATITDKKAELAIEITVQNGIGYVSKEQMKSARAGTKPEIGAIAIDAIFTPIRNVSFYVENMRVGDRTDFDRLRLEIETDGTITPEEAFFQACDILVKHFNIIFSAQSRFAVEQKGKEESGRGETKEMENVSKIPVEDLKLTGRTLNGLLNNGIKTVGGITRKSEKNLLELEGMGEVAIKELKRKLKKLGLELKSGEE